MYVNMYELYRNLETTFMAQPTYMSGQLFITRSMRAILIDWLIDVHDDDYDLHHRTLFLAVNILDRFLARRHVTMRRLQLIGITALFVAAKFGENYVRNKICMCICVAPVLILALLRTAGFRRVDVGLLVRRPVHCPGLRGD